MRSQNSNCALLLVQLVLVSGCVASDALPQSEPLQAASDALPQSEPLQAADREAPLARRGEPPGGNVLLLLVDDFGVDKLAAYEVTAYPLRTPNMDALVAEGVHFDRAWALPLCGPTRAALQTGRYPRRTGFGANESSTSSSMELDPGQVTIPEIAALSPAFTYDTSYAGKWHISTHESPSGIAGPLVQGWGWFAGAMGNLTSWDTFFGDPVAELGYYQWQKVDQDAQVVATTTYATTDTTDDAIERLAAMTEPWILQVAYNAAHAPYEAPPQDLVVDVIPDTGNGLEHERLIVEALDTEIGRLLASLSADVRARTNIILMGDNGTGAAVAEDEIDSARTKGTLYEPGVRVPFVVQGPLVTTPGSTSHALVHVVDVLPTIAELVGVDLASIPSVLDADLPMAIDGESLVPLISHPDRRAEREVLYTERFSPEGDGPYSRDIRAMRDERYKLVVDDLHGIEQFFQYTNGSTDEGLDLLPCGLDATQQIAYDRLSALMDQARTNLLLDAVVPDALEEVVVEDTTPLLQDISCI